MGWEPGPARIHQLPPNPCPSSTHLANCISVDADRRRLRRLCGFSLRPSGRHVPSSGGFPLACFPDDPGTSPEDNRTCSAILGLLQMRPHPTGAPPRTPHPRPIPDFSTRWTPRAARMMPSTRQPPGQTSVCSFLSGRRYQGSSYLRGSGKALKPVLLFSMDNAPHTNAWYLLPR
ncbi:hypothetical protein FA13DRAFT_202218 [Coprinellus micaceus]|uniref:Uncharacterized protein n=1 Tax=Coprinellus micaceus TaxID=71717 RepID=A0A4Y7SFY3_COPMI|nr:hypothetical protein FA13DRAFT_202218 [Coprinellus micaceus]